MNSGATPLAPGPRLVERDSGLVVPAHLAGLPEEPAASQDARSDVPRDPDGRRRIVFTRETRKRFTAISRDLAIDQLGVIIWCRPTREVPREVEDAATHEKVLVMVTEPIPGACGEIMLREDEDGADPGFGCKCSRIHFLTGATPGRW